MTKLHEILAVDKDKDQQAKIITDETKKIFKSANEYFIGYVKSLQMFDAQEQQAADALTEQKPVVTIVPDRLTYTTKFLADILDIQMQKESTNQLAKADIVMDDGAVIASNIPATMLLGMERELAHHRQIFAAIPTLDQSIEWEPDPDKGAGIYKSKNPVKAHKTKKTFEVFVLAEATKEHKAQVEKVSVNEPVGIWTTNVWSGMITPRKKAAMLSKFDELIQAVKKARMRANEQEVSKEKIGHKIFDYILAAE